MKIIKIPKTLLFAIAFTLSSVTITFAGHCKLDHANNASQTVQHSSCTCNKQVDKDKKTSETKDKTEKCSCSCSCCAGNKVDKDKKAG